MQKLLLLPCLMTILFLGASCTRTSHFGVEDRALQVPDEFGETEVLVARAARSPRAKFCPGKIAKARELGSKAAETYWACHNDEAMKLLAEARRLAREAEGCRPGGVTRPKPLPAPASALPGKVCITLNVQFDYDRAEVKAKYHDSIGKVAKFMKKHTNATAVLEGHTDDRGQSAYNMKLSKRRAESVKNYLVEKFGIESSRLTTRGYGASKPVATNKTAAGRQKNRCIEAIIECASSAD